MSIARPIRIGAYILAAIFALIGLGIALLHTPPAERRCRPVARLGPHARRRSGQFQLRRALRHKPGTATFQGRTLPLAGGLGGQIVIPSERSFAGGGTSVRGFVQDTVGEVDGANAVFIMNHELRFPIWSICPQAF